MDEYLRNDVDSHQALLIGHESKIKNFEISLLDLKQVCKSLADEVIEIKNTLGALKNTPNEINNLKTDLDLCSKHAKSLKEELFKIVSSIDLKVDAISKCVSNDRGFIEGVLGEYKQYILDQNQEGIRLNKKIDSQATELSILLKSLEESFKFWTVSKIQELLPKDNSSVLEDLKAEFLKKLEIIGIDCMNAVLKAGNISNQIPMLEKRIENISLVLKKYELNQ